jgi:Uma2 family endonuclease
MPHALKYEFVPLDEYLESERDLDYRSEYADGQVYAMVGASEIHATIATELLVSIDQVLPEECRVWQSDLKVRIDIGGKHFVYYPDIMAACGENRDDPYYRTNPVLIIEVLSPSTKRIDLVEKYENYIQIPSLLEYAIVSQDTPHLRVYRRRSNWDPAYYHAGETFELESVGLAMQVDRIYRRVRREVGLDSGPSA